MRRVLLAGLLALLAACGGSDADTALMPSATVALERSPVRPFVDRMADAPETTAFAGRRLVTMRYETTGGVTTELRYREDVYSDGQGSFAIVPVDVLAPAMTPDDEEWFLTLLENRDSFFFRYRDFRVREPQLFRENYDLTYLGEEVAVAGLRCVVLEVRAKEDAERVYEIAVDPETALVLRSAERTLGGQTIAVVEFETFELAPDLAGIDLHDGRFEEEPLDEEQITDGALGFELLEPSFLPQGYQHRETRALTAGAHTWAKQVFGDGCELMVFMHRLDPRTIPGPNGNPLAAGFQADQVHVSTVGPWTCVEGEIGIQKVILMGKVDEDALLLTLQSALH